MVLAGCSGDADDGGSTETSSQGVTLGIVQARGNLVAGVKGTQAGFGFVDENGNFAGL